MAIEGNSGIRPQVITPPVTAPQTRTQTTGQPETKPTEPTTLAPIDWTVKPTSTFKPDTMTNSFTMPGPRLSPPVPREDDSRFRISGERFKEEPFRERALDVAKEAFETNVPESLQGPAIVAGALGFLAAGGKVKAKIEF